MSSPTDARWLRRRGIKKSVSNRFLRFGADISFHPEGEKCMKKSKNKFQQYQVRGKHKNFQVIMFPRQKYM